VRPAAQRYRAPLGRVRGLGSAKEGVQHWWVQRLTAVALVPLSLWLVVSIIQLAGADHAAVAAWLAAPLPLGLMLVLVVATFWHAQLGLQVVIEDYVHAEAPKIVLLVLVKFACLALGLAAILALLFNAFGR
jgi:succinate dehydrogenase / fumarate reductase membrane anchor subunit